MAQAVVNRWAKNLLRQ